MEKQNPKAVIITILDIVGYGDGKEVFADELLALCQQQASVDLVNSLPSEKRSSKDHAQVVKKHFSKEQYLEAVRKVTEKIIGDYIQTISPKLPEVQKTNLQKYISSIT